MSQQRDDYRILYPAGDGPLLMTSGGLFRILDLSLGGAKIFYSEAELGPFPNQKETFGVTIKFPNDSGRYHSEARYLRHDEVSVSLVFTAPLPPQKLTEEQFRLRARGSQKN